MIVDGYCLMHFSDGNWGPQASVVWTQALGCAIGDAKLSVCDAGARVSCSQCMSNISDFVMQLYPNCVIYLKLTNHAMVVQIPSVRWLWQSRLDNWPSLQFVVRISCWSLAHCCVTCEPRWHRRWKANGTRMVFWRTPRPAAPMELPLHSWEGCQLWAFFEGLYSAFLLTAAKWSNQFWISNLCVFYRLLQPQWFFFGVMLEYSPFKDCWVW